tara:strand:- start:206 stop:994 length:789 start_codon:yes stop_codon:yes gene_type:complete
MLTQTFKRDQTEKISPKAAEERLSALFRDGIQPDALAALTPDGRRAVVQVLEDLVDQFPEVAQRTSGIIKAPRTKKGTVAAHVYPQNITATLSDRNGRFFFKHAFTNRNQGLYTDPIEKRYLFGDGSRLEDWQKVNVSQFSAGAADDALGHVVAHEFGHAVHTIAEDILHIAYDGSLEIGKRVGSRDLLRDAIYKALDDANLPRRQGDLARNVSHYATTNEAELFAESFAEVYNLGTEARPHARTIVNAILKVIDDYDGPLP